MQVKAKWLNFPECWIQTQGLFPPFERKKMTVLYFTRKSHPNKCIGDNHEEKWVFVCKGPRQKDTGWETGTCCGLFKTPHYLSICITTRKGLFNCSTDKVASVSILQEIHPPSIKWQNGNSPYVSSVTSLEWIWLLVLGNSQLFGSQFVTIPFPMAKFFWNNDIVLMDGFVLMLPSVGVGDSKH